MNREPTEFERRLARRVFDESALALAGKLRKETAAAETIRGDWLRQRLESVLLGAELSDQTLGGYIGMIELQLEREQPCSRCEHALGEHLDYSVDVGKPGPCQGLVLGLSFGAGERCDCEGFVPDDGLGP